VLAKVLLQLRDVQTAKNRANTARCICLNYSRPYHHSRRGLERPSRGLVVTCNAVSQPLTERTPSCCSRHSASDVQRPVMQV
jgi:hypothetical protein